VFYGINPISHNLIMADRAKLDSPAGYILATPGSGKSFMSKMEITWQFLNTDYEIIVIDPEREYGSLCRALGGSVINVDTGHGVFLNAFDMTGISSAGEISREKVDIAMMMVTSIYGKKLDAKQQGLVERNARKMFAEYEGRICDWKDRGSAGNPPASPTLTDLAANLASDPDLEAQNLAVALEMYTGEGTYNIFGNSTSVDISNRFTVFDIRDLPETLRPLGMAVIIEMLWKRIIYNKDVRNVRTLIIIDEIYLLFKMENSAQFLQMLYKRARKYGSIVTGITQNVDELLKNDEAKTTLSNSLFTVMLNQSYEDREEVAEMYGLSATEESYISDSKAGVGLIRFGKETVPFTNIVPRNLELYKLWTTKFGENLD
jgi:type IV secretory pathway VirB4 component